jgi:hypothetical protein
LSLPGRPEGDERTIVYCECRSGSFCLTRIELPLAAARRAVQEELRIVTADHVDRVVERIVSATSTYALAERPAAGPRPPAPHSRRNAGEIV